MNLKVTILSRAINKFFFEIFNLKRFNLCAFNYLQNNHNFKFFITIHTMIAVFMVIFSFCNITIILITRRKRKRS